ncbi:MAG: hypothetical protein AAB657_01190 [Patescibacteria group bacterium]
MPINQSQNITSAEILALARRERFLHIYHLLPSVVAAACFLIFLSSLYAKDFIGSSNLLFESSGNFFWWGIILASFSWYLWQGSNKNLKSSANNLLKFRAGFETEAFAILSESIKQSQSGSNSPFNFLVLIKVLLNKPVGNLIINRLDIDKKIFLTSLAKVLKEENKLSIDDWLNFVSAVNLSTPPITILDLWRLSFEQSPAVRNLAQGFGFGLRDLEEILVWLELRSNFIVKLNSRARIREWGINYFFDNLYSWLKYFKLNYLTIDLTAAVWQGRIEPVVARAGDLSKLYNLVTTRQSLVVVGELGAGKSILLTGLAQTMLNSNQAIKLLKFNNKKVNLSIKELQKILDQAVQAEDIALMFDDIEKMALDNKFCDVIANVIIKHQLPIILTTTPEFWQRKFCQSFLGQTIQSVYLTPLSRAEVLGVLLAKLSNIEAEYKVFFTYSALRAICELNAKFLINELSAPGNLVELMKKVAQYVLSTSEAIPRVRAHHVAEVVAKVSGRALRQVMGKDVVSLEDSMQQKVFGQDKVIAQAINFLTKLNSRNINQPLASFLVVGGRGVGKTEFGRALAQAWFGSSNNFLLLEPTMAESFYKNNILDKKILADLFRTNPSSVILVKHLENWPEELRQFWLGVVREAEFDLYNQIVIVTSLVNKKILGFDQHLLFQPLSLEVARQLTRKMIQEIMEMQKLPKMLLADKFIEECVREGFDSVWGAHNLRQYIEDKLVKY